MANVKSTNPPRSDDLAFDLHNTRAQLCSLLGMCYGNGAEMFEQIGPINRDHIIWLAHDLADKALGLVTSMELTITTGGNHG